MPQLPSWLMLLHFFLGWPNQKLGCADLFPEDCRHFVTDYDVTWPETFVDENGRSSAKL